MPSIFMRRLLKYEMTHTLRAASNSKVAGTLSESISIEAEIHHDATSTAGQSVVLLEAAHATPH
jgi:hypothetical protein